MMISLYYVFHFVTYPRFDSRLWSAFGPQPAQPGEMPNLAPISPRVGLNRLVLLAVGYPGFVFIGCCVTRRRTPFSHGTQCPG